MSVSGTPGIIDQMPNHEEGEFELVLGNKQLLMVFFLVVLLLGVFFSMGYVVGRNTAPATTLSASSKQPPIMVEPTGGVPVPVRTTPPVESTKPSALANPPKVDPVPPPVEPPKMTKVDPPKPVPVVKPEPVKADPPKPKPEPPKPAKVDPPKVAATTKGGGTFLQVVATKQPEASQVVAKLVAKGFPASLSPVPDSSLLRVVVGPLGDAAAIAKTRDGLHAEGYKPIIRKF